MALRRPSSSTQAVPVVIQNSTITNCGNGVMPIIVKNGKIASLTLRNLTVTNNIHPVTIDFSGGVLMKSCSITTLRVSLRKVSTKAR